MPIDQKFVIYFEKYIEICLLNSLSNYLPKTHINTRYFILSSLPVYKSNILPIRQIYLNQTFYYKYDQGSVNYFEKYVKNGLLKILSNPLPKNSLQGLRHQKTSYLTVYQYIDQKIGQYGKWN